jgi:hypothetical protein
MGDAMGPESGSRTALEPSQQGGERRLRASGSSGVASRLGRLLNRMAGGGLSKYEQGRIFLFPFSVDEDWLKKFDERARIHLSKILSELEVDFASETRFQDLSSLRFDNFTDFLSKAGDRKDPESVVLRWAKFAVTANADLLAGEISLVLTTEKRLLTQDNAPGDFSAASIELRVSGSDQTMTESAYYDLEPYIKSSCLGGIYRPLWIFRNKWFIQIVSQILSWMGLFIGMNLTNRLFDHGAVVGTAKALENILSTADLSK